MNNKVYLGKIVSTHGIKGELRIISDFEYKDKAFKVGTHLIIDDEPYLIKIYRKHIFGNLEKRNWDKREGLGVPRMMQSIGCSRKIGKKTLS